MGTWIDAKECPPVFDGEYLVCDMNRRYPEFSVRITKYCEGNEYWDMVWRTTVTHWMNVPELPKGYTK